MNISRLLRSADLTVGSHSGSKAGTSEAERNQGWAVDAESTTIMSLPYLPSYLLKGIEMAN